MAVTGEQQLSPPALSQDRPLNFENPEEVPSRVAPFLDHYGAVCERLSGNQSAVDMLF
jgi:hypothetical protein